MAKVLLYSDIHIHAHKGKEERLQDCLDCLYWVFQTAQERNIKDVIFGGDLFQDRRKISVYAYHQVYNIFAQFKNLRHWLLLGNHDLWFYEKKDISSVIPFDGQPNVTVIDTPSTIEIAGLKFDFLPFTHDPITTIVENFPEKSKVLIGHIAVDGAFLNFRHHTQADVSVEIENDMVTVGKEIFTDYKRVFLGHYHGAQKLDDVVEYIGSTLQLTFNEADQEKHIIVLDTEDLSVEYITNEFSPRHYILKPEELDNVEIKSRDFVKTIADPSKANIIEIKTKILEKYPDITLTFTTDKKKEVEEEDKLQKFNLAEGDTLERYIQAAGYESLEYNKLLNLGKEICLED